MLSWLWRSYFKCFEPYMGMTAILFKRAEPLEQIENTPFHCKLWWKMVSEKKFKDYTILHVYLYTVDSRYRDLAYLE